MWLAFTRGIADNLGIARALPSGRSDGALTDARLGRIVRLLTDHAMVTVSGTKVAEEIGVSRSEVWRLVQQLRSMGVEIAGRPATGYQLERVPDLLLPDILAPLLKSTRFGEHIHHFFRLGSSNVAAMHAAARGAPEGSVFLAEEQTAGRGRGGHSWHSAASSGIYCSVVLRPKLPPAEILVLSLAAGLAAADAVEQTTGLRPDLKWPNDLLIAGSDGPKKFCGILTELNAELTRVRYAVVGVGINVNQAEFPAEITEVATSLRIAAGREFSRVALTAALLQSLDRETTALEAGGRAEIVRRFEQRSSWTRGRRVRIEEERPYQGVTEGLDELGFLRVRVDRELRTVLSGSVRAIS